MSKFVDKLVKLSRASGPAIGFKQSVATRRLSMLLAVEVSSSDLSAARDAVAVGIDALVVRIDSMIGQTSVLEDAAKLAGDTGWGVHINKLGPDDASALREHGCDLLILSDLVVPVTVLSAGGLGKILSVDPQWSDGLIRSLGHMALDALLLDTDDNEAPWLSLHRLVLCHRLASLSPKPILVSVLPGLDSSSLQALHSIGVEGILLKHKAGATVDLLQKTRQDVDALPAYRGRGKSIAILPRVEVVTPAESEEEEEEEEE